MAKRNGGKRRNGDRKHGRQKKKVIRVAGLPISLFVRGKISGEQYFRMTNQSIKRKAPSGAF